jgi:hypothetical protein
VTWHDAWTFWVHHIWPPIHDFPWVATIQSAAPIWVAYIATRALRTWKLQAQAERKAKLLDELLDGVHEYLDGMVKPITIASHIKIGMDSQVPPGTDDKIAGAIAFITRVGTGESARLFEAIRLCEPSKRRIESLVVKGQVLGFKNYGECQKGVQIITREVGVLAALGAIVSSTTMNWENPIAHAQLVKIVGIDLDLMSTVLEGEHRRILGFAKDAYADIYR